MANNNLAAIAQFWAREGLMTLLEMTPALGAVNRQYSLDLASYGDQVKAYRPGVRKTRRRTDADDMVPADATLDPVNVLLDQWFYDSMLLKDRELSVAATDLRRTHLIPALDSISRGINRSILGRVHAFLNQGTPRLRAGRLGGMTRDNSDLMILEAQEILDINLAPEGPKTAIVHPTAQTFLRANKLFAAADQSGSDRTLRTGVVGKIYNTDVLMSQGVPYAYLPAASTQSSTVNNSPGGYAAGTATALTVVDPGDDWAVGEYAVIEGNDQPTYITVTGSATSITLNEPLKYAVAHGAVITHYPAVTNEAVERVAGYQKEMLFTVPTDTHLQAGQLISFGTTSRHTYNIIEATVSDSTHTSVLLDRPLDATVASAAAAFPGPAGGAFNIVLDPNALAFVSRPTWIPPADLGVASAVQAFRGLALRVTAGYLINKGGVQINFDVLGGVSVLDTRLAVALLS